MIATTAGTKVWTASYDPLGGVHVTTGAPIDLRFPGQWFQAEAGLHQNWMRDYDPTTGRCLRADPLGLVDGASVYGYARQSPGRWVDPRGEYCYEYTGNDGNTYIECKSRTKYCVPGQDCAWRSPTENNREYDECTSECYETGPDRFSFGAGAICAGIGEAVSKYCGPVVGTTAGATCVVFAFRYSCQQQCWPK